LHQDSEINFSDKQDGLTVSFIMRAAFMPSRVNI